MTKEDKKKYFPLIKLKLYIKSTTYSIVDKIYNKAIKVKAPKRMPWKKSLILLNSQLAF